MKCELTTGRSFRISESTPGGRLKGVESRELKGLMSDDCGSVWWKPLGWKLWCIGKPLLASLNVRLSGEV